jgi:hypothetical protein
MQVPVGPWSATFCFFLTFGHCPISGPSRPIFVVSLHTKALLWNHMQRSSSLSKLVAGSDQLGASQHRAAHPAGLPLSELSHDELAGLVLSSTMLCPSPFPSASPATASTPSEHEQQPPPMQTKGTVSAAFLPTQAGAHEVHAGGTWPSTHSHYAALTTPFPSPDRPSLQRAAAASQAQWDTLFSSRDPEQSSASAWASSPNQQDQADCFRQIANLVSTDARQVK